MESCFCANVCFHLESSSPTFDVGNSTDIYNYGLCTHNTVVVVPIFCFIFFFSPALSLLSFSFFFLFFYLSRSHSAKIGFGFDVSYIHEMYLHFRATFDDKIQKRYFKGLKVHQNETFSIQGGTKIMVEFSSCYTL